MSNADFFIRLVYGLRDYDEAVVLGLLVAHEADDEPVRTTAVKLARFHLDCALSAKRVQRATARLVERGLLSTRVHPNRWTEYKVNSDALSSLLDGPLPSARYLPGLSAEPIPFLSRRTAAPAPSVSLNTTSEDPA